MDDIAIRVEGLSKRYRIQQGARARYGTLRDALAEVVRAPFRRRSSPDSAGNDSCIWALKDVSFEVKRGEVVGIIGRNGAGKTTLLKILSRITEPTEGWAEVRGRVGSLLEVGTGFHPELTGRENIYLNGAILGMKKAEIDRKFDEIVAFAEIEKFIDTPVKFYSSGMYVRLAFAVAAHLDPEILLVDEVLAVGDAAFQKKCLGKMGEVAAGGRTVLFVSHNMGAVVTLCNRAILLSDGRIRADGQATVVVERYTNPGTHLNPVMIMDREGDDKTPVIEQVRLTDGVKQTSLFFTNGPFRVEAVCHLGELMYSEVSLGIVVSDIFGRRVFAGHFNQSKHYRGDKNKVTFSATIWELPLLPGKYTLSLYLASNNRDYHILEDFIDFEVAWNAKIQLNYPPRRNWGVLYVPIVWDVAEG